MARVSLEESGIQVGDRVLLDRRGDQQYPATVVKLGRTRVQVAFRYKKTLPRTRAQRIEWARHRPDPTLSWEYPITTPEGHVQRVGRW